MANSKVNISLWEKTLMEKNDNILNAWKNESFSRQFSGQTESAAGPLPSHRRMPWPGGR